MYCPKTEDETLKMMHALYANVVGCLMYAIVLTKPDISHAVSVISRYMASPGKEHWKGVKWILRYPKRTLKLELLYGRKNEVVNRLVGYVDYDYARDLDRIRSLTDYKFMFNGCLINWKACLQYAFALSITEAEFTVVTESVKKAIWLKGLLSELSHKQETITIFCDNFNALHLCKNPTHHERTKYIDVKLRFLRHEILRGIVK